MRFGIKSRGIVRRIRYRRRTRRSVRHRQGTPLRTGTRRNRTCVNSRPLPGREHGIDAIRSRGLIRKDRTDKRRTLHAIMHLAFFHIRYRLDCCSLLASNETRPRDWCDIVHCSFPLDSSEHCRLPKLTFWKTPLRNDFASQTPKRRFYASRPDYPSSVFITQGKIPPLK